MTRECRCRIRYIAMDLLMAALGMLLFNVVRYVIEDQNATFGELSAFLFNRKMYCVGLIVIVFWMGFFALTGYYNRVLAKSRIDEFFLTAGSVFVGVVIEYLFLAADDVIDGRKEHLLLFALLYLIRFLLVYSGRSILTTRQGRRNGMPEHWPRVLLLGSAEVIEKLEAVRREMHYRPAAVLTFEHGSIRFEEVTEAIARSEACGEPVREIYVLANESDTLCATRLLYRLYSLQMPVKIYVEGIMGARSALQARTLRGLPLYDVTTTNMSDMEQNVKWLFDRVAALALLILSAPVCAVLAVMVRCSSPGPVIYRQERIGMGGKPFQIYKFRTMYTGAEKDGPQLSHDGDRRITKLGHVLRKYRLDELPQFYNVLIGDMSFVGPRPERAYYVNQIIQKAPFYYLLHQIRPGITSWGMVRYGYASTVEEMIERLYYDWLYYEHMSVKLDIAVLLRTIGIIVTGKGK